VTLRSRTQCQSINLFISCFACPSSIDYSLHSLKHEIDFNLFRDFFSSHGMNKKRRSNTELSCNHSCCGNAISIKYCECVFILALFTRHTKLIRHIRLSVACQALSYLSILDLIKGKIF
jgi:hypothetical protein